MITLISYGFKFGKPDCNFCFDVSYLRNPWREEALKHAERKKVIEFVMTQPEFQQVVNAVLSTIITYYTLWPEENMIIAICCNAGADRSPIVVDAISKKLGERDIPHEVKHPFVRMA